MNPWFQKCGRKMNLFCDNHITITYWLKKKISCFWSTHFFWKGTVTVSLRKLSSNAIFRWYTFRKFYIVKFIYFSERPNTVKERFWNTFDWKISLVSTKIFLHQCHPPYTRWVSSHRFAQFLGFYNICIIYLHEIEARLKVTIAMFYFYHLKNLSKILKNIFNFISIYFWKKVFLLTNYISIFWRHEKWPNFSFKSLLFSIWSHITF